MLILIVTFLTNIRAQDVRLGESDSVKVLFLDSVATTIGKDAAALSVEPFKPNPNRAVIYSAIFPGLGQIYNRKYWKLPIVYGGFLGCVYAITWNGNQYNGYKKAYNDFTDTNEATKSWEAYVPYSWGKYEDWDAQRKEYFNRSLKNKKDFYRRNRDLSYIITIGVYAICMIDAYVDAQLFDFDISQDLSLRLDPVIIPQTAANKSIFGLQCSLTF
jgi:hypothetical protein